MLCIWILLIESSIVGPPSRSTDGPPLLIPISSGGQPGTRPSPAAYYDT